MELSDAVRRRRMVRAFTDEPIAAAQIDALVDLARRAPSAGNTQATAFLVLDQPESVARYWDVTLPEHRRASFRWPGLISAPVLVIVAVRPSAYVARYAEPDKAATGLGGGEHRWPVPYWWVDAGASAEHLLLGAVDAGLGACLFGLFDHEAAVAEAFGVPSALHQDLPDLAGVPEGGWRLVATIAVGRPAPDAPGRSAGRPRRPLDEVLHRNRW